MKYHLISLTLIAIFPIHGMDIQKDLRIDSSKKRNTPESSSFESTEKKLKTDKNPIIRSYSPASLLDIASFFVSNYIASNQISKELFLEKIPKDIHHLVERFEYHNLKYIVSFYAGSEKINTDYISLLLSLGADPNELGPLFNSILHSNIEHIEVIASNPRTNLSKALDHAISFEKGIPVLEKLIQCGANISKDLLNMHCSNASRYAKKEHFEIMELFLKNGASPYSVTLGKIRRYKDETKEMLKKYGYKN